MVALDLCILHIHINQQKDKERNMNQAIQAQSNFVGYDVRLFAAKGTTTE